VPQSTFVGCTLQNEVDKGKLEHVQTQPSATLPPRTRAHRTHRTQQRLCCRHTPLPLLPMLSLDCVSAPTIRHTAPLSSHTRSWHIHWTWCQNVHNPVRYTPSVVQQPCSRVVVGGSIRSPAVGVCTMRVIGRADPSSQHVRLLSLLTRDHSSQHASLDRADIIQLSTGSRELDKLLQGDPLPPSCTTHFLAPLSC
jgi:hypothetical protein